MTFTACPINTAITRYSTPFILLIIRDLLPAIRCILPTRMLEQMKKMDAEICPFAQIVEKR